MRLEFLNAMIEEAYAKGIESVVQPDACQEMSNFDVLLNIAYAEGVTFARDKKRSAKAAERAARSSAQGRG